MRWLKLSNDKGQGLLVAAEKPFEGSAHPFSLKLLTEVVGLLEKSGFRVVNVDSTVVMEAPRLRPHIDSMRQNLAAAMQTDIGNVSVKATTSEKMGFAGRGEGASALATCLIEELAGSRRG